MGNNGNEGSASFIQFQPEEEIAYDLVYNPRETAS
jgi:shikimate 5-dehydrogenase